MHVEAEKAMVAIHAAIGTCGEQCVKEKVFQPAFSRFADKGASALRTPNTMTLAIETHTNLLRGRRVYRGIF
jgi:hypothetical protein